MKTAGTLIRLTALVALGSAACGGGTQPPPGPGTVRGAAPDLRGVRVLVLPVQQLYGVDESADQELLYALRERSKDVAWVPAEELDRALARSPSVQTRSRGLPVGDFIAAEVRRIGDPLFGDIRRMTALVEADAVLLPIRATIEPQPTGDPKVRFVTTLIESRTGRVLWFSVLEGAAVPQGDPAGVASVVEEVARTLLWYVTP